MTEGPRAAMAGATASAWAWPSASSCESDWPWIRRTAFQSVRPCRSRIRSTTGSAAGGGGDVRGERDGRAVAPEPLERVELPLLLVLDMDDDLAVVDQHPAAVALALAADRL